MIIIIVILFTLRLLRFFFWQYNFLNGSSLHCICLFLTYQIIITIYHTEDKTFYEYTREGEVVEIKVVPKKGETYYLIPNGGADEGFRRATESKLRVPTWVIFSW